MASLVYPFARSKLVTGVISWTSSTFKVMLVGSGYTPSASHQYVVSASANEISGTGYTSGFNASGRKTLTGNSVSVDGTLNRVYMVSSASISWSGINAGTVEGVLVIKENTSDADSLLVVYLDTATYVSSGNTLQLQWDSSGLFYM